MAFQKKTWTDRLVEFPGRRLLKIISQSAAEMLVDVFRNEGNISREGDPYNAANMNDLEQRITDEFDEINNNLAQQPSFICDSTGKITGYKTLGGADTVFPFKSFDLTNAEIVQYAFTSGVAKHIFDAAYNGKEFAFCVLTGNCSAYNSSSTLKITIDQINRTVTFGGAMNINGLIATAYYI